MDLTNDDIKTTMIFLRRDPNDDVEKPSLQKTGVQAFLTKFGRCLAYVRG